MQFANWITLSLDLTREKLPTSGSKLMGPEVQVMEDPAPEAVVVAGAVAEATAGVAVTPRGEAEDPRATLPATADLALVPKMIGEHFCRTVLYTVFLYSVQSFHFLFKLFCSEWAEVLNCILV